MTVKKLLNTVLGLVVSSLLFGCATVKRESEKELKHLADHTLAGMVLEHQGLQAAVGMSAGYLVVERSGSGIPMIGKRGRGVLTNIKTNERVEVRVLELEIDGGWGVGDYLGLYLFKAKDDFEQAFTGSWSAANAGTMFVTADGNASAEYEVKSIKLELR